MCPKYGFLYVVEDFKLGFVRVLVVNSPHLSHTLSGLGPLTSGRAPDYKWTRCGRDTSKTRTKHE